MKSFKAKIAICILGLIGLYSCESGTNHKNADEWEEENENALPFGVNDTIDGEKVSNEYALLNHDLEYLQRRVENVKSPDMLMLLKTDYQHTLDSLTVCSGSLPQDEQAHIKELCKTISEAYQQACSEYEVPADGVIDNLKNCIERISSAHNRMQVVRFTESRRGMLRNLEHIHLCVESNSSKINEVKRLATQLKEEVNRKAQQFDVKL